MPKLLGVELGLDRTVIRALAKLTGALVKETAKTMVIDRRKFYFNEDGEIEKIIDYDEKDTYYPGGLW